MASSAPVVRAFGAPLRRVRLPLGMKPLEAVTSDTATIDALVGETQVGDTMKRVWRPPAETAIKAVVVYAHGLNEHSGRFSRFAAELVAHGFAVTSCDAPGHGMAAADPSKHGFFTDVKEMAKVLAEFAQESRETLGAPRQFYWGYSFGGMMTLRALLDSPHVQADGAALLAPLVRVSPHTQPNAFVTAFGKLLVRLSYRFASLPLIAPTDGNTYHPSMDEVNLAEIDNDHLYYMGKMRIASGLALLEGVQQLAPDLLRVATPLLVQHGTNDRVTSIEASRDLYAAAQSADKTLLEYEGAEHDLLRERPEIARQVMDDAVQWFLDRC